MRLTSVIDKKNKAEQVKHFVEETLQIRYFSPVASRLEYTPIFRIDDSTCVQEFKLIKQGKKVFISRGCRMDQGSPSFLELVDDKRVINSISQYNPAPNYVFDFSDEHIAVELLSPIINISKTLCINNSKFPGTDKVSESDLEKFKVIAKCKSIPTTDEEKGILKQIADEIVSISYSRFKKEVRSKRKSIVTYDVKLYEEALEYLIGSKCEGTNSIFFKLAGFANRGYRRMLLSGIDMSPDILVHFLYNIKDYLVEFDTRKFISGDFHNSIIGYILDYMREKRIADPDTN